MVVPRVCGGFDVGTEQVGRNEDLVMLEEYAAHGDGVTVGLIGVLPLGPLGIILGGVQRARAPALFSAVDAGGDELNDGGTVFVADCVVRSLLSFTGCLSSCKSDRRSRISNAKCYCKMLSHAHEA